MNDDAALIRGRGLRLTAGRLAVLDALDKMPHTDAESVFTAVRVSVPGTSIQSVHNILGDLTAAGLVRRIEPAGSAARYERRIGDNHHHVVCTACGAVGDVDCVVGQAPCLEPSNANGFTVHTAEVTFWGLCADCVLAASHLSIPVGTNQGVL
jgi:Fe2+ or Zn2+ uptake regulation protein